MAASSDVNQRLYCCRLQLDHYRQLLSDAELPAAVIQCMAGEASAYHLKALYRAYLKELAATYNYPQLTPQTAEELIQAIQSAELVELQRLESSESWLAGLLACGQSAPLPKPQGLIASATASGSDLDVGQLTQVFTELQQLIERQRGLTQEW